LARVEEALVKAAGGRGQVVFVVGEMGMGKTRLAEEALALAGKRDFLVPSEGRRPPTAVSPTPPS
jgi:predicted ATPase